MPIQISISCVGRTYPWLGDRVTADKQLLNAVVVERFEEIAKVGAQ